MKIEAMEKKRTIFREWLKEEQLRAMRSERHLFVSYWQGRYKAALDMLNNEVDSDKVVDSFLADIGMSQYQPLFAKEHIDAIVLRGITDDDLEKIGVNALGDRKKILAEIHALFALPPPSYDDDTSPPSYSKEDKDQQKETSPKGDKSSLSKLNAK